MALFGLNVWINGYLYFILRAWLAIAFGLQYLRKFCLLLMPGKAPSARQ